MMNSSKARPLGEYSERWSVDDLERSVIRKHTDAPLRLFGTVTFHASAALVFERVTDPALIANWFGMITGGRVEHDNSCDAGQWGKGSKRYCYTRGMGTLDETVLHYDAPHSCIYSARNFMMPVKDHAAMMVLEPLGDAGCRFTWRHYYDYTGLVMRHLFPKMMLSMMNKGLAKLVDEVGGVGGKMEAV